MGARTLARLVGANESLCSVSPLRVALDLDGSLEYLANSMTELANALDRRNDLELVRFRSRHAPQSPAEVRLRARRIYEPLWRHGWGPAVDTLMQGVEVVHVAGVATPPTRRAPLVISVDDLRPLRRRRSDTQRVVQLVRSVRRGATLAVASHAARHEVQSTLGLERSEVVVVKPVVGHVPLTKDGSRVAIWVAGETQRLIELLPLLEVMARTRGMEFDIVGSSQLHPLLHATAGEGRLVPRTRAADVLARARVVVSLTDGARFPSFAVAALAAGVPVVAWASTTVREVLSGAATLVEDSRELLDAIEGAWDDSPARRILVAAGAVRASDYSAPVVATAYAQLYSSLAERVGV